MSSLSLLWWSLTVRALLDVPSLRDRNDVHTNRDPAHRLHIDAERQGAGVEVSVLPLVEPALSPNESPTFIHAPAPADIAHIHVDLSDLVQTLFSEPRPGPGSNTYTLSEVQSLILISTTVITALPTASVPPAASRVNTLINPTVYSPPPLVLPSPSLASSLLSSPLPSSTLFPLISPPTPLDACWATSFCADFLDDVAVCWAEVGGIGGTRITENNPLGNHTNDVMYQECFCQRKNGEYKNIFSSPHTTNISKCFTCFSQAGLDSIIIPTPPFPSPFSSSSSLLLLRQNLFSFCNTPVQTVNLYDMLHTLNTWLHALSTLDPNTPSLPSGLVERYSAYALDPANATPTAGVNVPSIPIPTPVPTSTPTTGMSPALLAAYNVQVPPNWPYTAYAVVRRAGQMASFTVMQGEAEGERRAVGCVVAEVLWNGRPLYTPAAEKGKRDGELYQPGLKGWGR